MPASPRLPLVLIAAAAATAGALPGCGDEGTGRAGGDPAEWRTWVVGEPGSLRPPAPPPEAEAPAEAPAGRSGLEVTRPWLEHAMDFVAARAKDPVAASRAYALVAVSAHDASIAARYWQGRMGRREGGDAPAHPSEPAAVAGAASRVLAHLFPEQPAARLEQGAADVARAESSAGRTTAAGARAGLALGHEVAARTIAHARRDGSDRRFDGRLPRGRGRWAPPPGSAARPVAPLGGTWRPWLMTRGNRFRPSPPPKFGSLEFREEALEVVRVRRSLTREQKRIATFWAGGEGTELPPGIWIRVVLAYLEGRESSTPEVTRIFAYLTVAMADAGIAAWDAKYAYWSPRPENAIRDLGIDPDFEPLLETPFFPSYVSGHASYSGAAAEVLAELFPDDASLFRARAEESAVSRLYGGIHFRADNEAGLDLGRRIGRLAAARARADGAGG